MDIKDFKEIKDPSALNIVEKDTKVKDSKDSKTKDKVKVRINIPTLKPEISWQNLPDNSAMAQLKVVSEVYPIGAEIEIDIEQANIWANEEHYVNKTGLFGVMNASQFGIDQTKTFQDLQNKDISYSEKIRLLNEYGKQMDKACKQKITRCTIL